MIVQPWSKVKDNTKCLDFVKFVENSLLMESKSCNGHSGGSTFFTSSPSFLLLFPQAFLVIFTFSIELSSD